MTDRTLREEAIRIALAVDFHVEDELIATERAALADAIVSLVTEREKSEREPLRKLGNLSNALWRDAEAEIKVLRRALGGSLALQSHYAELLNMYDDGKRKTFASIDDWLRRLDAVEP